MKLAKLGLAMIMAYTTGVNPVWAGTATATATVSVTITAVTEMSLTRDNNSAGRGSSSLIVFDKLDSQDCGANGNSSFMYAPYRCGEQGKNWHLLSINANGTSLELKATVTGNIGRPAKEVLGVWCGGFYSASGPEGQAIEGTPSRDWEFLDGFSRRIGTGFTGIVPFNYRLREVGTLPPGTRSDITVTYTVITGA